MSDTYEISLKSREGGLAPGSQCKKGAQLGQSWLCVKIAQPHLQSSHGSLHGWPAAVVRVEAVPSAAALVCSGDVRLSSFRAARSRGSAQEVAKPGTSSVPRALICCLFLVVLPTSSFQMAFFHLLMLLFRFWGRFLFLSIFSFFCSSSMQSDPSLSDEHSQNNTNKSK